MVSSAAAAMVVTVMDSTLWYRPGDDGLKAPAVVTTLPARSWLKKLSLWREGRAHVSYCLLTRQGQGCGRLPWHTSSRWVGAAAVSPAARLRLFALVVLVVRGPGARSACRQSR